MITKRIQILLIGIISVLSIPAIAMLFTKEVNWDIADFAVMGTLLLAVGLTAEYILRKVTLKRNRIVLLIGLFILLLVIWAELAVGIFDSPFAGS